MNTQKLKGSQIIIETLIEQGVTHIFGYPGGQVLQIYDQLYKNSERITHVLTAHEQGAAHAADGYARATGKVGVVLATSGPGATNLTTGLAAAMMDSVPVVAITGNVPTYFIGKDSFQEINTIGITMPITKHNFYVTDVTKLAETIREAFRIAKSGRPGPVLVDIPSDVQAAETDFTRWYEVQPYQEDQAPESEIWKAVELINAAKRPYIYVGGGAASRNLGTAIMELADKIDACIGSTFMGLSCIPGSCGRYLGMQGMHGRYASTKANWEADLIIGIGVRFSDRATGDQKAYRDSKKIIQIDPDFSEINKNISVDVGLIGDIVFAVNRILKNVNKAEHPEWMARIETFRKEAKAIRDHAEETAADPFTSIKLFDAINELKTDDTIITTDVGQHQMWAGQFLEFEKPRKFLSSGGLGAMGYGLGAAIGANLATGEKTVMITGDASFSMNLIELATAVSYQTPIVIVLLNNNSLGMVRQLQAVYCDSRYSATLPNRKTDYCAVARGYGVKAERVTDIESFEKAFAKAMASKEPCVIEAMIDTWEMVLPMLPNGGTIDDLITEKHQKTE
ncbi:MAG: biosynthetic-type acetolactate synthase large subunit [Firmicutes bacterium]|nr:biosynthetic-type acetolactate synthase large subunit [Bacillota bacterium]